MNGQGLSGPNPAESVTDEAAIGGKPLAEMSKDELIAALEERLRVNVGLLTENTELHRKLAGEGDPAVDVLRELVTAIDTYGEQRLQYWPETVAAVNLLTRQDREAA